MRRRELARLGGDEFIVLLSEIQSEGDARFAAERVITSLQKPWEILGHIFQTTSSIGISFYPTDGLEQKVLVKRADMALYHAKEKGRNTYQLYSEINKNMNDCRGA